MFGLAAGESRPPNFSRPAHGWRPEKTGQKWRFSAHLRKYTKGFDSDVSPGV
jgi:hypothetical protein